MSDDFVLLWFALTLLVCGVGAVAVVMYMLFPSIREEIIKDWRR